MADFDSPYVMRRRARLVDPADPADVASVNALQDQLGIHGGSEEPFRCPTTTTTTLHRDP